MEIPISDRLCRRCAFSKDLLNPLVAEKHEQFKALFKRGYALQKNTFAQDTEKQRDVAQLRAVNMFQSYTV